MEHASCRLSGAYKFQVAPIFFEDFWTPVIKRSYALGKKQLLHNIYKHDTSRLYLITFGLLFEAQKLTKFTQFLTKTPVFHPRLLYFEESWTKDGTLTTEIIRLLDNYHKFTNLPMYFMWFILHALIRLTLRLLMSYIYIYIYIWSTYSWCF